MIEGLQESILKRRERIYSFFNIIIPYVHGFRFYTFQIMDNIREAIFVPIIGEVAED
jgi:hypothetical protein